LSSELVLIIASHLKDDVDNVYFGMTNKANYITLSSKMTQLMNLYHKCRKQISKAWYRLECDAIGECNAKIANNPNSYYTQMSFITQDEIQCKSYPYIDHHVLVEFVH